MSGKRTMSTRWLDAWLPPRCVAWDTPLPSGSPSSGAAGAFGEAAGDTLLVADPIVDEVTDSVASYAFGGALRDAVVAAKYLPDERRARRLARFWADHLQAAPLPISLEQAAISFVPSHWRRRLWRGFDLSPLLADALSRALGLDVIDALRCSRHEKPLSAASSRQERQSRAGGRYSLRVPASVLPRRVVLVDDVVTTGATLKAARAPLEAAGIEVVAVALARTPA